MMTYRSYTTILFYLSIFSIFHTISADEACDKSKCRGPIAYYKSLKCIPIYGSEDSCCAVKYDCDHLKERSKNKCYINGNVYDIGTPLKDEDALPCDIGCTCATGYDGIATFNCAVVDCFHGPTKPGCYRQGDVSKCCPGKEVCPENPADRARCEVGEKTYHDGESFEPPSDPPLNCICQPGYTGLNVKPFCEEQGNYCSPELRHASDIHNNCAPVYYETQNPTDACSVFSRCQNVNDTVVKSGNSTTPRDSDYNCTFGNLTMKLGDELNQATDYNSVCVKCVCEVPPLPTCRRLPESECDVTVHPPFSHFDSP